MKKLLAVFFACCLVLSSAYPAAAEGKNVVVSFYPLYIFTMNVIGDIPDTWELDDSIQQTVKVSGVKEK